MNARDAASPDTLPPPALTEPVALGVVEFHDAVEPLGPGVGIVLDAFGALGHALDDVLPHINNHDLVIA